MTKFSFLASFIFLVLIQCNQKSPDFDLLIVNGTIYDGTGSAPYLADLGIKGDRIIRITDLSKSSAVKKIDASGLIISPGFIDMHTHLEAIMELPLAESLVRQGVTFALGGPDGGSPWPISTYLDSLSKTGIGVNIGYLIGHNTICKG